VAIPHYTQKKMNLLVDVEDEREVVAENFDRFKAMYRPVWKEHFGDVFNLREDGTFEIRHDDATRKYLLSHVNDNVFQNLESKTLSLRSYN
jgi:hypothetical protein